MPIKYNNDELIHILQRYANQLGRSPTTCDLDVLGGPRRQVYYRHFGRTWAEVIEAAGLPPVQRASLHEKYIHRDTPSREEVIDAFKSFIEEYGYMPLVSDYPDFYRASRKLFKSDEELVKACGFDYGTCGFDSATILVNTEKERMRRMHIPVESSICHAVKKSMPGSTFSCEFIKKCIKGEYDE